MYLQDLFMQLLDKHADHYQVVAVDQPSRDTCEWFTNHPIYLEWWHSLSHMLKWLFAEKGCGKSVLLQHIFNWATKNKNHDIICRFFFRNSKSSAHAMICAILHQIFSQRPQLLRYAAKHCNGRDIPSVIDEIETSKLFGMFREIATVSTSDRIVCVIDALDECPTQSRKDFIDELENMFSTHANNSGVRMIVSMRPDPTMVRRFGISTIIRYDELFGSDNDIQRMIAEKINHMDLKEHFKERLRSQLPQRAGQTFLLASLNLATISKQKSLRLTDLDRLVRLEKPRVLYENALRFHPAHRRDRAFRLLKIVLVATEALTPGQLDLAECLKAEDRSLTTLDRESNPEEALRDVCGVLLCVLNGKVFIFHETVREYLFEQDDFNPTGSLADLLLPDAHQILADRCIWFLNLATWDQVKVHGDIKSSIREARKWLRWRVDDKTFCIEDIVFLEYAAANWFRHVDMSMNLEARLSNLGSTGVDWVLTLPPEGSKQICDIGRPSTALWMMLADMSSSDPGEIARFGSPSLITSFFAFARAPIDPDQIQSIEALADGIARYEQIFLWRFFVFQCQAYRRLTQILFKVACKHNWQVGMSLFQNVSVDPTEALSSTVGSLSTTTLQLLLQHGAVVNDLVLSEAAKQGSSEHIAILLQSCDESSLIALRPALQNSLRISLSRGNLEFASVLRGFRDVNVNYHEIADTGMHDQARDHSLVLNCRTLELYHMFTNHSDGCRLWQTHWDSETCDGLASAILRGRTTEHLITAAVRGHHSTCRHILRFVSEARQPDINFVNPQGCSLLGALISRRRVGYCYTILKVLRLGADPDLRSSDSQTRPETLGHGAREVLKRWVEKDSTSIAAMIVAGFIRSRLQCVAKEGTACNPTQFPVCVCPADTARASKLIARRSEYLSGAYKLMSVAEATSDRPGKTPLAIACNKGRWDVAEMLIKHKASLSMLWEQDGLSSLFMVENFQIKGLSDCQSLAPLSSFLHLLQSCHLSAEYINRREEPSGCTLGHFIMLADERDCDAFLNIKGVDLNIRNLDGETPLHWLMRRKGPRIDLTHDPRSELFSKFDLTLKSPGGSSFLDAIFEGGRNQGSETCFASVKSSDLCTHGTFFLHKAIRAGARDWIDFFACLGDFDANAQDNEGATALHLAVTLDDVTTTLILLSKGVRTDILDRDGKAAMHRAIFGSCDIVKALVESERVDLEILSGSHMTPLLEAFAHGTATNVMETNVRLLVDALIARADLADGIKPLDFVTNSIPHFQRNGENLPELLWRMQSLWTSVPQSETFIWNGSDSEDSDWMSIDEESAEE